MRKKVITRLCVKPGNGKRACFGPRNSKIVYQNSRLSTIPTLNMINVFVLSVHASYLVWTRFTKTACSL